MMSKLKCLGLVALVAGVIAIAYSGGPATAQVKKGKTRLLETEQLMHGLVSVQCGALKKGLDAGPSSDKAWKKVAMSAALLNEASYILMADGRCPDGTWAGAAKTLRGCSAAVLKAIDAKDTAAAKGAFAAMTKACGTCHKAHKKSK